MASEQDKINYQRLKTQVAEVTGHFGWQEEEKLVNAFFDSNIGHFISIFTDDDGYIDREEGELFDWIFSVIDESRGNPQRIMDMIYR